MVAGVKAEPRLNDFKPSLFVPVRAQLVAGPLQDHLPGVRRRQEGRLAQGDSRIHILTAKVLVQRQI